ncbi:uncharacterized protein LOC120290695 [Eucalyptus grandis]|uniref:uncharacterized protein LOC120290695 n=1 Tax=Eucalyptus grandis TaxID=71139 RepID=UPI00192E9BB7|nr:uncharacterized protein LOC120290695 [Eucalyptus grandis]
MYKFSSQHTQVEELPEESPEAHMLTEVKHIVDALRLSFLPLMNATPHREMNLSSESKCLFDLKFEDGELKIPHLVLHDGTESLFRNIITFEQCYYKNAINRNLINYMVFMDHLVDTSADTELLMDKGIIENWLSNKKAHTDLINVFCKETSMLRYEYYFHSLNNELVEHCQSLTTSGRRRSSTIIAVTRGSSSQLSPRWHCFC